MITEYSLRQLAARVGGQAQLREVRTRSLQASLESLPERGRKLGYRMDTELEHARVQDRFLVQITYTVDALQRPKGRAKGEGDPFADLEFSLMAIYDLPVPEEDDYPDDELDAFAKTTVQFALYPYARELVQSLTARLGIPPLTLGTMRLPLDASEVADVHPPLPNVATKELE